MKSLDEIIAKFNPEREHRYGNPDTAKISAEDAYEYEHTAAGVDSTLTSRWKLRRNAEKSASVYIAPYGAIAYFRRWLHGYHFRKQSRKSY